MLTFPTAASPSRTSFTLLLGFGAAAPVAFASLMVSEGDEAQFALRLLPTLYSLVAAVLGWGMPRGSF